MTIENVIIVDVIKDQECTVKELLSLINGNQYWPLYKHDGFVDFLSNFLKAIVNSNNIILLDGDFTNSEIEKLGYNIDSLEQNVVFEGSKKLQTLDDVTLAISQSKSEITVFTSGTTGLPKAITHTVPSLTKLVRVSDSHANDVWGFAYNPTHMAGLQVFFQAILNANKIVNVFGADLETSSQAISSHEVTHISATPTFYRLFLSVRQKFPRVKRITFGGEKSDKTLHSRIEESFPNAKINNIYASTEIGSLLVSNGDVFKVPQHLSKKIKIENNSLLVSRELVSRKMDSPWYDTGDLVEVVSDNPLSFKFLSRKSEMINTGGYKVNPQEVEEALCNLDNVKQARVFGKPNSVLGNVVCAEIVMNDNTVFKKSEISVQLKEVLQEFKVPRIIKNVPKLETTRTGKIKRG